MRHQLDISNTPRWEVEGLLNQLMTQIYLNKGNVYDIMKETKGYEIMINRFGMKNYGCWVSSVNSFTSVKAPPGGIGCFFSVRSSSEPSYTSASLLCQFLGCVASCTVKIDLWFFLIEHPSSSRLLDACMTSSVAKGKSKLVHCFAFVLFSYESLSMMSPYVWRGLLLSHVLDKRFHQAIEASHSLSW